MKNQKNDGGDRFLKLEPIATNTNNFSGGGRGSSSNKELNAIKKFASLPESDRLAKVATSKIVFGGMHIDDHRFFDDCDFVEEFDLSKITTAKAYRPFGRLDPAPKPLSKKKGVAIPPKSVCEKQQQQQLKLIMNRQNTTHLKMFIDQQCPITWDIIKEGDETFL